MTLFDSFIPLIYVVAIIGISAIPIKIYMSLRLKQAKSIKAGQGKTEEEELKNWILTAIQNPHIAIDAVEKEIQQLEINQEKGWPYQFALMKKQALELAAANPKLAQWIGPKLVDRGFKLWKKVPKLVGSLGL